MRKCWVEESDSARIIIALVGGKEGDSFLVNVQFWIQTHHVNLTDPQNGYNGESNSIGKVPSA